MKVELVGLAARDGPSPLPLPLFNPRQVLGGSERSLRMPVLCKVGDTHTCDSVCCELENTYV